MLLREGYAKSCAHALEIVMKVRYLTERWLKSGRKYLWHLERKENEVSMPASLHRWSAQLGDRCLSPGRKFYLADSL